VLKNLREESGLRVERSLHNKRHVDCKSLHVALKRMSPGVVQSPNFFGAIERMRRWPRSCMLRCDVCRVITEGFPSAS